MHQHAWPTKADETFEAWATELAQAANATGRLAERLSPYAGGGVPAHKLREATRLIDEARTWVEES
jgi:anti-sigma factor RsiW